jgi:hypothetical protein
MRQRVKGVSESGLKRDDGGVRSGSGTSGFGSGFVFASLPACKLREGRSSAQNRGFRVRRSWKLRCLLGLKGVV